MLELCKGYIRLDKDLVSFLNQPEVILIYKNGEQSWLRVVDYALVPKLLKQLVFGTDVLIVRRGKAGSAEKKMVEYPELYRKGFDGGASIYRTVNYESKFLLFPSVAGSAAADRQQFWKQISGYHEHKEVELQKEDVRERSKWLAQTIQAYQPASVLELGCGGGRNLYFIQEKNPDCQLYGVEINPAAVEVARERLGSKFRLLSTSIYELDDIESASIDVVFTSGVLMHIPGEELSKIKANIERIARKAIIHYELHGPSHDFDFHRYPRDYRELYSGHDNAKYEVFADGDFRNAGTESFQHCLLTVDL